MIIEIEDSFVAGCLKLGNLRPYIPAFCPLAYQLCLFSLCCVRHTSAPVAPLPDTFANDPKLTASAENDHNVKIATDN